MDADCSVLLRDAVAAAYDARTPLVIEAGGSKGFYGRVVMGEPLDVARHRGLIAYEPTELVCTVRSGTPVAELESVLSDAGQMLPFEPPRLSSSTTIGGTVATGLAGPARPWQGAVRDAVLGVRMINGRGQLLRFGGEVMKNVAGYDVSRLMTGSFGTLGVLLDVSLKVVPQPAMSVSRSLAVGVADGCARIEQAIRTGVPITGAVHDGDRFHVRLAGSASAVRAGISSLGGEEGAPDFWSQLRDHQLPFLRDPGPDLWRFSLPPQTDLKSLPKNGLADWNGQQYWVRTEQDAAALFAVAHGLGGHASRFRSWGVPIDRPVFQPLPSGAVALHQRIKAAFDPAGILNPGRMYEAL